MTATGSDPATLHTIRIQALVHELARAYLDRHTDDVLAVDERLRGEATGTSTAGGRETGLSREVAEMMPVESAGMMCEDYLRTTKSKNAVAELLPVAGRLVADTAPPALRDELAHAVGRLVAGDTGLFDRPAAAGLPGVAGAHLYAAVVAAAIDHLHPMVQNQARVKLEQDIRVSQSTGRGMPAAETVAYVSDEKAEQVLLEVLPWVAEMTDPRHDLTKRDLRALVQLYLLDHPVIGPREKSDLERRIGKRLEHLTTAVGTGPTQLPTATLSRTPAPAPLSPEQIAARQRAERALRQGKGKKRR